MAIYLDNAATTPVAPPVVEAMQRALGAVYGNPSSLHALGVEAERLVRDAREAVAPLLGVRASEIVFTSGGTEANNLALRGALGARGGGLVTTAVEHSSVLEVARRLGREGREVTVVPVDGEGLVDLEALAAAVRPDTALVSVMAVNNEVGAVQPVAAIGEMLRSRPGRRPLFHVDAVQAAGKLAVRPRAWGADLVAVSSHKIHGPKGAGALYVRDGVVLEPLLAGGDQERGLRPGTENVPGIAGFGAAASLAADGLDARAARLRRLRERLVALLTLIPDARVHGPGDERAAPHIVSTSFPGVRGETLVHRLEQEGVYVSTGSACHSRQTRPSHVLVAMGLPPERVESSIRLSLSGLTGDDEIEAAADAVARAVAELRALVR